jgi:tripartite-type tricarboxylate transporter receptor subunit TctC
MLRVQACNATYRIKEIAMKKIISVAVLALTFTALPRLVGGEDFYQGKTVRFVVGFSAGGGFDAYTRAIARHIGKHIPGKPTTIVENMPGAGSMIAANYIYKQAKPDGLTVGNWIGGLILQQLIGVKGIAFDAAKLEWIGSPVDTLNVCAFGKKSGITSIEKWMAAKSPVKIGAIAPGSNTSDFPRILMKYTKLPIQLVEGFKGVADIRLAVESGEVAGLCPSWEGIKSPWRKTLESGDAVVVLQAANKPHPDLPQTPLAMNLISSDEGHQVLRAVLQEAGGTISRPYSLPPGTPKDRVQILRTAFQATMRDPDLKAEADKARLDIHPLDGEQVEKTVAQILKLSPTVLARIKEVILPE